MKIRISGVDYDAAALGRLSLFDILELKRQTGLSVDEMQAAFAEVDPDDVPDADDDTGKGHRAGGNGSPSRRPATSRWTSWSSSQNPATSPTSSPWTLPRPGRIQVWAQIPHPRPSPHRRPRNARLHPPCHRLPRLAGHYPAERVGTAAGRVADVRGRGRRVDQAAEGGEPWQLSR